VHRLIAAIAAASLVLAVVAVPPVAAQAPSEADRLFEEGRQLLAAGRASEACPKFERSQELDPGRGTLINLAACYEAIGHLVEALAVYEDVLAQSGAANDDQRLDAAKKLIEKLEPRIPRLTVIVDAARPAGLVITIAGVEVPASSWADVPVNPGPVEIVATAEGYEPWRTQINTAADGQRTEVSVPALVKVALPGERVIEKETRRSRGRTIAGLSIAGAGAVMFGASIVLALGAKNSYDTALDAHCDGMANGCDATGVAQTSDARKQGNLATIVGGVGLVALAGGVVLWLTAPRQTVEVSRPVSVIPQVSGDGAGVVLVGSF
jgi:tetratricopeptide (TPR) repeat protein